MSENVERLVVKRQRWMFQCLIGYPIWLGALTVMLSQPPQHAAVKGLMTVVMLAGMGIWGAGLIRISALSLRMQKDPLLSSVLQDERIQTNRYKAALFALFAVMATQGISVFILSVAPQVISALPLLNIHVLITVTAFVGAFLYLDQKE